MITVSRDKMHNITKNNVHIGQIYLVRAESKKLRCWVISCFSGLGFNTYDEARSYAKDNL